MTGARARAVVLSWLAVTALGGCGVQTSGDVRTVAPDRVPHHLLDPAVTAASAPAASRVRSALRLYWIGRMGRLEGRPLQHYCVSTLAGVVSELLDQLIAGPRPEQRARGLGSAVPSSDWVHLARMDGGHAVLSVDPEALVGEDRVSVVSAQLVLSVTSIPGVDAVEVVHAGQPVQLPLPGGKLTEGPFTKVDYDDLLASPAAAGATTAPPDPIQLTCPSTRR